jgi:hypothetical protein
LKAFLVYQCGIANVFEVDAFNLSPEGRNARRLIQADFRTCANFARGMAAAGCSVKTVQCNMAGDISEMQWSEDLMDAPFHDKFIVVNKE